MKQKEIIGFIFESVDETGELLRSKEENEAFDDIITYLTEQGFITSTSSKDEHYMKIEYMLLNHNHVSLKNGFEHGFKTAAALLTQ